MTKVSSVLILAIFSASVLAAGAGKIIKGSVTTPMAGVICDKKASFCADSQGISVALTKEYLGDKAEKKLMDMGQFDMSEFVLTNGVRCDTIVRQIDPGIAHFKSAFTPLPESD